MFNDDEHLGILIHSQGYGGSIALYIKYGSLGTLIRLQGFVDTNQAQTVIVFGDFYSIILAEPSAMGNQNRYRNPVSVMGLFCQEAGVR